MEELSDNALMIKVRDGNLNTLGLLFERYKKPLFGFFYGMNSDHDLSEDLVQNVFYRIIKYRNLFRGDGDFRTWLFHIARNVSHDHFRKNKIRKKESVDDWRNKLSVSTNKFSEMQQQEELDLLSEAIAILPEDKREVLLLAKFQEKKYKEIGLILGCSEGAVKVKVFRALQELKDIYMQLEKKS